MQIKFEIENCKILGKIVLKSYFWLYSQLFSSSRLKTPFFYQISTKFAVVLCKRKFFEKSKMAAKMADMLWNDCCHGNSS